MGKIVTKRQFKYGQWTVTIELRDYEDYYNGKGLATDVYCVIDCTGNWIATQGILYDYWRDCCAFDNPYCLSPKLRRIILEKARKLIAQIIF